MQIAGTTSQAATATAATTTPVQPLGSPTSTMSQTGNVVMVIIMERKLSIYLIFIYMLIFMYALLIVMIIEQH